MDLGAAWGSSIEYFCQSQLFLDIHCIFPNFQINLISVQSLSLWKMARPGKIINFGAKSIGGGFNHLTFGLPTHTH